MPKPIDRPLNIAVIGAGVSGLSAAWLLSQTHRVTLYEQAARPGGHVNTVNLDIAGQRVPVDTGFIVYNDENYPNFTAMLDHLGVETLQSDMSFAVSLHDGRTEYSSRAISSFIGHGRNLLDPRFWSMNFDILRFCREAPGDPEPHADASMTLGDYLDRRRYGQAFQRNFLLAMASAIWSSSAEDMRNYPACAFIRFFENHGLLRVTNWPLWRTIKGGSASYVEQLMRQFNGTLFNRRRAVAVHGSPAGVRVRDSDGHEERFDRVLLATHSDQALHLLGAPTRQQRTILGAIPYSKNRAVLHGDTRLMPRRRSAWSSWNYVGDGDVGRGCAVTYWMNKLQSLPTDHDVLVTLNPEREPQDDLVYWAGEYEHPVFTPAALSAQRELWSIQGQDNIWLAGAWWGAGFHEDGLQAGLAAAEDIGGVRRPWRVNNESSRLPPRPTLLLQSAA